MSNLIPDFVFDKVAKVYAQDETTGAYTVVLFAALAVRLALPSRQPTATAVDRQVFADLRTLIWDPSYTISEDAQVEVDGQRWNLTAGTVMVIRDPLQRPVYARADVVRAR